jgi:hypothetical protein
MSMEESEHTPPTESEDEKPFTPRGIMVFLTVMLTVYALYWAYLWFVVTVQRGVGG